MQNIFDRIPHGTPGEITKEEWVNFHVTEYTEMIENGLGDLLD